MAPGPQWPVQSPLPYGQGSRGMFISIKYGDPIDLCEENGTLKLLFLVKFPEESATKYLTPRGSYYICKVEHGAPGTKHENGYRAFFPIYKHPPSELLESLRNQCDFLEKSRLRLLKSQDARKPPTMESLLSCMANLQTVGKSSGKAGVSLSSGLDEEGTPRKATTTAKSRAEASRKEKHLSGGSWGKAGLSSLGNPRI
ncbi:uncharacterized protein CXorf65 homolog isoform X2 [Sceloporus undulatus]|uniref:uncharacterized protein CXorf65 homolog isoform X2 n=1 Tax=Sceloporus undulatus TaxID=8520 RepID=UPI001C4D5B57|nr:uncharacterized protein CXorf65 homolog isoform X2 [Sceloporus undulatus]